VRILVCGGRDFADRVFLFAWMDLYAAFLQHHGCPITELVHGAARGADSLADEWGRARLPYGHVFPEPAKWGRLERAGAGHVRNAAMLHMYVPKVVVAFPGGSGTADMCLLAKRCGIQVVHARREDLGR
jgi:hypothetical protein